VKLFRISSIPIFVTTLLATFMFACSDAPDSGELIIVSGHEMVYIPGGVTVLGDTSSEESMTVRLKPYLMGRTEVTNGQFREFTSLFDLDFPVPHAYDELPVTSISWETADAYAAWKGMRLPTEAEWELGAGGINGLKYPWGNRWDARLTNGNDDISGGELLSGSKDGFIRMAPVGLFPDGVSPYGISDMAGNVWEWTSDWYDYLPDTTGVIENWTGPSSGIRKVMRGGSFKASKVNLRTFHRAFLPPSLTHYDLGFRLASDYPPSLPGELPAGEMNSDSE
jgi:formylglycine-generating enzyme required for sulfatase activity